MTLCCLRVRAGALFLFLTFIMLVAVSGLGCGRKASSARQSATSQQERGYPPGPLPVVDRRAQAQAEAQAARQAMLDPPPAARVPALAPPPRAGGMRQPATPGEIRALWVTRWDYSRPEHVTAIMANARTMGFNTVFFQVRGAGTTYFRSAVEPWAWELTSRSAESTGREPTWDPLRTAIQEARARGLSIHAYINTLPGWEKNMTPPAASRQLWVSRRDWFMVDRQGRTMPSSPFYSFLNPALPEVQRHLADLVRDMLTRYDVDGVHLDYIRWPGEKGDYSYDARTRAMFAEETSQWSGSESAKWNRWRASRIRLVLRHIYAATRATRPGLVSAAVFADPDAAQNSHMQWSWEWTPGAECDMLFPMNYSARMPTFTSRAEFFLQRVDTNRLAMGLNAEHPMEVLRQQVAWCRQRGIRHFAFFAYSHFTRDHRLNAKGQAMARFWQEAR
jgi:uncharacterized lipoprotein YddW (UPF0748 family)